MEEKTYTEIEVANLIAKVMENFIPPVYMTPQQVSDSLHITPDYVRSLAQKGILKGNQTCGRWLFTPQQVREYAEKTKITEK